MAQSALSLEYTQAPTVGGPGPWNRHNVHIDIKSTRCVEWNN